MLNPDIKNNKKAPKYKTKHATLYLQLTNPKSLTKYAYSERNSTELNGGQPLVRVCKGMQF